MGTILTDLSYDILSVLLKYEYYNSAFTILTTNTHVNHIGTNIVVQWRNAEKQRPPDHIDVYSLKIWIDHGNANSALGFGNDTPKRNQRHRNWDLPAHINANGTKRWWKHGKLHRDGDTPAVIYVNGSKEWWKYSKRHRNGDLPALIRADGYKEWWKNGVQYTPKNDL